MTIWRKASLIDSKEDCEDYCRYAISRGFRARIRPVFTHWKVEVDCSSDGVFGRLEKEYLVYRGKDGDL